MKCPKCGYISFEYLDDCNQCEKDLTKHKETFSISAEKHGFINILKYVELENTPNGTIEDTDPVTTGHLPFEEPPSDGEIILEQEDYSETLDEPVTAAADTNLSDEATAEEIQLEEVSITLDDIDTTDEQTTAPVEISIDEHDSLHPEEVLTDDTEPDSLTIEEIDLSDSTETETSPAGSLEVTLDDSPVELEEVEILPDQEGSGKSRESSEIEFSIEDMELEDSIGRTEPPEEERLETSIPADTSGDTPDLQIETETHEPVPAKAPEEPFPADISSQDSSEAEELTAKPENQSADIDLEFSLDPEEVNSPEATKQTENLAENEDDLELSLDEFDNFNIDIEDFDLSGDVPITKDKGETDSSRAKKGTPHKGEKKGEDKNSDNHTLDIDLDDLYKDN